MIKGIEIEISAADLQKHLSERANYHAGKEEFYKGQVASLQKGMTENQNVSNDPISSLKRSAESHGNKRAFFQFIADHIITGETYRLNEEDLARMEVYSKYL